MLVTPTSRRAGQQAARGISGPFDHPSGRAVRTLLRESFVPAGYHDVKVDGTGDGGARLASGVYFYRVDTADGAATGRFVLMK